MATGILEGPRTASKLLGQNLWVYVFVQALVRVVEVDVLLQLHFM